MENKSHKDEIIRKAKEVQETKVRIALFGQPGAGKSSLINAIIGEDKFETGVKTDTTKSAEEVEYKGLSFVDLPGYGTSGFPKENYLKKFDILNFDIFLCIFDGKLREADVEFFNKLREVKKICIFVRTKEDTLFQKGRTVEELKFEIIQDVKKLVDGGIKICFVSIRTVAGIDELESCIQSSLGDLKRQRFVMAAKAYTKSFLDEKRKACKNYAMLVAAAASVTNLVPIPGLSITANITAVLSIFENINDAFSVSAWDLNLFKQKFPYYAELIDMIIPNVTTSTVVTLMEMFGPKLIATQTADFIPIIGPVIAPMVNFAMIKGVSDAYIDAVYKIAIKNMENNVI